MKKLVVFFAIAVSLFATSNVLAGVRIKPKQMTVQEIDSIYKNMPYIVNSLQKDKQTISCEGNARIYLFIGQADGNTVNMCMISMPEIMDSQMISMQLIVNGRQEFIAPIKLSYQVYDNPKYINGKIVVRASIGQYNPENMHFYIVINPNGAGYDTEVATEN